VTKSQIIDRVVDPRKSDLGAFGAALLKAAKKA